jgi:D-arabinose 1-dehydrogenase-like Zn-dependent alcohol dehydrogenase
VCDIGQISWRTGDFPTPIFDVVLKRIRFRGSIVRTRKDLSEAIAFAAEGKIKTQIHKRPLGNINAIFRDLNEGKVDGRIVTALPSEPSGSARRWLNIPCSFERGRA